ncbi:MAG: S8 family serine peptidase [Gemmatimonadaceae bacterium]
MNPPSFAGGVHGGFAPCASLALAVVFFAACADSTAPVTGTKIETPVVAFAQNANARIPDEYIVVFADDVTDVTGRANSLLRANGGGTVKHEYRSAMKGFSARMSSVAAARIAAEHGVASVEQDQVFAATGIQGSAPWGLDRVDQASLPLNGSYSYASTGSGVSAYIIDSGIRRTHSQFGGRVVPAFTSISDGYGADGCHWHGTHVAGTVGGSTYGVAKGVSMYSVRVLDCNGSGTASSIIAGIDWVTANFRSPAVANISITGGYSAAVNTAVQNSVAAGVTYVVAAGNSLSDACGYSPASAAPAITVGATTNADAQSSFSNWGTCLDMYAPGSSVLSAGHTDDYATRTSSGTSMAAPHVAGAAAVYLEVNRSASPATVAQAVIGGATSGTLSQLGSGSPNRLLRTGSGGETVISPPPAPPPAPPPVNAAPRASFNVSCQKSTCSFSNTSSDDLGIVSHAWSFGDGATSAAVSPVHTYRSKGTYTVTLVVRDASNAAGTASKTVSIKVVSR